jgi:hypothetical protein
MPALAVHECDATAIDSRQKAPSPPTSTHRSSLAPLEEVSGTWPGALGGVNHARVRRKVVPAVFRAPAAATRLDAPTQGGIPNQLVSNCKIPSVCSCSDRRNVSSHPGHKCAGRVGGAQSVVQHMAKAIPQRFVAKSGPANRLGQIFIDYLRNGHAQTTAAAFSARARPGMGVSIPVPGMTCQRSRAAPNGPS